MRHCILQFPVNLLNFNLAKIELKTLGLIAHLREELDFVRYNIINNHEKWMPFVFDNKVYILVLSMVIFVAYCNVTVLLVKIDLAQVLRRFGNFVHMI